MRLYRRVTQSGRPIEHRQVARGYRFDVDPTFDTRAVKQALLVCAFGALDQATYKNAALQYRQASLTLANVFLHRTSSLVLDDNYLQAAFNFQSGIHVF